MAYRKPTRKKAARVAAGLTGITGLAAGTRQSNSGGPGSRGLVVATAAGSTYNGFVYEGFIAVYDNGVLQYKCRSTQRSPAGVYRCVAAGEARGIRLAAGEQ